jgi:SAM-dependent methyltransferase
MDSQQIFKPEFFKRTNEEDDILFYSSPRRLVHIDEIAIQKLSKFFLDTLPPKGIYLDLMSGWRSHLPNKLMPSRVIGLGLNSSEMAENPQLSEYIVQDINQNPSLVFDNDEFDAAICTVSIQYLTKPIEVFNEVNRVLKPGGFFLVSFSSQYFSAKVIAAWIATNDEQHIQIVGRYFKNSSNWTHLKKKAFESEQSDPLYVVWAKKAKSSSDSA